jgi:hypothetical protein
MEPGYIGEEKYQENLQPRIKKDERRISLLICINSSGTD